MFIPLNSIHLHQIGKFGIIFDAIPREIDDLAVSFHQFTPLGWGLINSRGLPGSCQRRESSTSVDVMDLDSVM